MSTSNYRRIQEIGERDVTAIINLRRSAILEFPTLQQQWHWLEQRCATYSYDIFKAWVKEPDTAKLCRQLRIHLMGISIRTTQFSVEMLTTQDARVLAEKGTTYGDSWKKRGGVGAFMMLARKWDRIENISAGTSGHSFDLLLIRNSGDMLDDVADLRRYLLLVEDEMEGRNDGTEPGHNYVDQG